MESKELVKIYEAAIQSTDAKRGSREAAVATRDLDILFYGMACFHPDGKSGYRVLFPNGLTVWKNIPVHSAGIWVRDRKQPVTARWSATSRKNDFFIEDKRSLVITGILPTALDATEFDDRLTVLTDCDSSLQIDPAADTVLETTVDCGKLTAHYVNAKNMIVVRWRVQAEASTPVRFTLGGDFVEVPPAVTQVFLANVGASHGTKKGNHFRLYRKLSTQPDLDLKHPNKPPKKKPQAQGSLVPDDPTFGYVTIRTPDIVCSPVQSYLP